MFDKLEDLLVRYQEIMNTLNEPGVADDQNRFRKLMKDQAELTPIVEAYNDYKKSKQDIEDSLAILDEETDEEMKELAKEELNDAKARSEELEQKLKILLLPKDPNDDKNVIVEIRAGAGGDEAALFAAEIYRMYIHYIESRRWKSELVECEEIGIGGMKNVTFIVNGAGAYSVLKYESGV
ncbi:MAG: PCRF domain-containing protein, partial [Lachnospiraceae bacterium]|nr:PCRF domain-containing protein [Lachnospiraceae bacterium]